MYIELKLDEDLFLVYHIIQMWPDLVKKAKEGGLNAIETYIFWNAHEPLYRQVSIYLKGQGVAYIAVTFFLILFTIVFI